MSTNFPTSLDTSTTLPTKASTTPLATNHVASHQNLADAVIALETKIGVTSSAVNTTHTNKLSGVADGDKAVSKTGSEVLTNKTLTAPVINVGSDADQDLYKRNASGVFTRIAKGSANQVFGVSADGNTVGYLSLSGVTSDEKSALAGQSGTAPSASNKFIDNAMVTEAKTASKIPIRDAQGDILVSTTPTAGDACTSKTYADLKDSIYKNGTATYDLSTASGEQNIAHGLGKIPKKIKITTFTKSGTYTSYTIGVYNGTTNSSIKTLALNAGDVDNVEVSATKIAIILTAAGGNEQSAVATFDATNIILTWTKAGSPSGTANILWEAEV
jgi:hypothetical protein